MRFLLHGTIDREVDEVLRELGHAPVRPAEVNLPNAATPTQVLETARVKQLELMTASRTFLDAILPGSGRRDTYGRVGVFLQEEEASKHAEAIARLFERYKRLTPGRLYTVTAGRVKVRQLPTASDAATAF